MAKDKDGKEIEAGDIVIMRCIVKGAGPLDVGRNLYLEDIGARDSVEDRQSFQCNSSCCWVVEKGPRAKETHKSVEADPDDGN